MMVNHRQANRMYQSYQDWKQELYWAQGDQALLLSYLDWADRRCCAPPIMAESAKLRALCLHQLSVLADQINQIDLVSMYAQERQSIDY